MASEREGWAALLSGGNAAYCAVIGGGMVLHALNTFITVTVMPSVVRDIGGLQFFAWATTLYVLASLLGGAFCSRVLHRVGARWSYRLALLLFVIGSLGCGLAPNMGLLLAGRFVQGLGAGTLSALSYTMVRLLFAQPLWSRAISVISATWGIATLLGPAVGGIFAQYGAWRAAFWSMCLVAPILLLLVEVALPRGMARTAAPRTGMALASLAVLTASVLCVSIGSAADTALWGGAGMIAALAGLALFVRHERAGAKRLLPSGACDLGNPLGVSYAAMALLLIGVNTEIFVPYFLQILHNMRPIDAGYLSALMSAGWTTGSVISSGARPSLTRVVMLAGPLTIAAAIGVLFLLMPHGYESLAALSAIGCAMAAMGLGIGMAWPHVAASIFTYAPEREHELAAASITVVTMVTNAFGSAMGGMLTNLAGLTVPGGAAGASSAAAWLFGCYILAPLAAAWMIRRLLTHRGTALVAD